MKKLFGAWNPEEAHRFHAPIQNIASCNLSVDFCTARYVIL
jgi:hypothetical protein